MTILVLLCRHKYMKPEKDLVKREELVMGYWERTVLAQGNFIFVALRNVRRITENWHSIVVAF